MFNELDVVTLTHDIRTRNLQKGDRGTIVHVYENGNAYEVEFVDADGTTKAILTLLPDEINKDSKQTKCRCHCHLEKDLPPGVQCRCIKNCPHCKPENFSKAEQKPPHQ